MANTIVDFVNSEWSKDAKWDKSNPDVEINNVDNLHAKYLRIMSEARMSLRDAEVRYRMVKRDKIDYYNGRLSEQELKERGWKPFKFVLKNEIDAYLDADSDIIKAKEKIYVYTEVLNLCEQILKQIHQRSWSIRTYVDFQKFINGV